MIDIDDITKALKVKHTWTIFKIIITTDVKKLGIEDIVSKEYIKDKNNENKEPNALLLNEKQVHQIKEKMEIKNNENNNINNNEND